MTIQDRHPQATPLDTLRAITGQRLVVGTHVVDMGSLRVTSGIGQPKLTPKAAGVLLELARRAGQTVTHDELLDRVWAGTCPTRNVLTQAIKELRRALDSRDLDSCIRTIPKIGYRLVVPTAFEESILPASGIPVPKGDVVAEKSPASMLADAGQAVMQEGGQAGFRGYVPMIAIMLLMLLILIIGAPYFV